MIGIMKKSCSALLLSLALASPAFAQTVLHDTGSCGRGITFCTVAVADSAGRPAGVISFSVGLGNGGYYGNTRFGGSFTWTDARGVVNHYPDFNGTFTAAPNPLPYRNGMTFVLRGTFNGGANSCAHTTHSFCRSGRGGGCSVTDLGATTVITVETPIPPPPPPPSPPLPPVNGGGGDD